VLKMSDSEKCPTKRPDMSDEIAHSQQTMNQGNKISSVRPDTINIELGLDLYVLLYYRGLRSVNDIYRLQSAHIENNREPGLHFNKERHQIMPFIFAGP